MRTGIYIRVSTQEQAQEGFSLAAQTQKLQAYCDSQDWILVQTYADEGLSAKDTGRPGLQKMMSDVEAKKLDVVLVYKLDRLTRSVSDLYSLLQLFDHHEVGFKSATEVFDTTTAMGRLFITMVAAMAQWERETIGERVAIGMAQKAREGKRVTAVAPFGYIKQKDTLVVNEGEAEVVREIFRRYISGQGVHKLKMWLSSISARNGRWDAHTITYILENPVYIGKLRWGYRSRQGKGDVILTDGHHPAIIDAETWAMAQSIREKRRSKSPRLGTGRYSFAGMIYCSQCGAPLIGYQGRKFSYYRCSNKPQKKCRRPMIRVDILEAAVVDFLEDLSSESLCKDDLRRPTGMQTMSGSRDVQRDRRNLQARKKRLWDALELGIISTEELMQRMRRITEEEGKLRANQATDPRPSYNEQPSWIAEGWTKSFKSAWSSLDHTQRKELLCTLIDRIDADKEHVVITLLHDVH